MSASELPADPTREPWSGSDAGPRAHFQAQLRDLDAALVAIAEDVARAIAPANRALLDGLPAEADERARDSAVRGRYRELEDACFVLIAREAPVGVDLREVVAIVRAVTDIERSSKLLVHIAETFADVHPERMADGVRIALRMLAQSSERIFTSGVTAWQHRDGLAVNELHELDDEVDRLQAGLLSELYLGRHPVEQVVALALLGRYYERLADHGVALAYHIAWAVTGLRAGAPL